MLSSEEEKIYQRFNDGFRLAGWIPRDSLERTTMSTLFECDRLKLKEEITKVEIASRPPQHSRPDIPKFRWPFGESNVFVLKLNKVELADMTRIPKSVKILRLDRVNVTALKGIEDLSNLKILSVMDGPEAMTVFSGGLLRLLKSNVTVIESQSRNDRLNAALSLVYGYLEERDIILCQNALIDAGLDQYAKL